MPGGVDCVGMRTGFHRAGVVAGGQHDRGDAVHDAFVVRGGAVRVGRGQSVGVHDVVDHLWAAQGLGVENSASPGQPQIRLVGQDA